MSANLLLALDQGTSSSRALLFDRDGGLRAMAQRPLRQMYPRPGWVEHDPTEIVDAQRQVAVEALEAASASALDVAAVGITNQRETTVLWDRASGAPVGNAIVWQDRRTAESCDRLRDSADGEFIVRTTGLQIDPYFSASKLRWMLEADPRVLRRAESGELAFGTIDSWLTWNLTRGRAHVTDASNASRTCLFDLRAGNWSKELLAIFGIPEALLPTVVDSAGPIAECDAAFLGAPVPITGLAGDQQAALFGQLCLKPGMAKNTYGTGCFLLINTGERPLTSGARLLGTVAWRIGGRTTFALEGAVFVGGAVVQWLRDGLGLVKAAEEIEDLAASVADAGGVVFVPAFTGLGAPHWDAYARGAILGISRGTTGAHLARAALESIAQQVTDVAEAMATDRGAPIHELRVDGAAAANDLLLQLQADLLGQPVVRPAQLETTALGAAYLAGLGAGLYGGLEELQDRWRPARRFLPKLSAPARQAKRAEWGRAVQRASGWAMPAG